MHALSGAGIETNATLYAGDGTALLSFRVRAHGWDDANPAPWPDFNNTGDGLNVFSSNGDTPTGLMEFDLNSPEPEPQLYGPYPVNRAVQGGDVARCGVCHVIGSLATPRSSCRTFATACSCTRASGRAGSRRST